METKMITCHSCRKEISADATKCKYCGSPVDYVEYEANDGFSFKKAFFGGRTRIKVADRKLADEIVRMFKIRNWAFSIAVVLIAAGIAVAIATGGAGTPAGLALAAPAAAIVGLKAETAMLILGALLGGVTGLKKLYREYKITEQTKDYIVLTKKKLPSKTS